MNIKDIKAEIRRLRKLKLQCRPGSVERLDLEHKIKGFKKQLADINTPEPEKAGIIAEILQYEKINIFDEVYYNNFTIKELQKHLDIIKVKRGIK